MRVEPHEFDMCFYRRDPTELHTILSGNYHNLHFTDKEIKSLCFPYQHRQLIKVNGSQI